MSEEKRSGTDVQRDNAAAFKTRLLLSMTEGFLTNSSMGVLPWTEKLEEFGKDLRAPHLAPSVSKPPVLCLLTHVGLTTVNPSEQPVNPLSTSGSICRFIIQEGAGLAVERIHQEY